jgi:uncharacterized protein YacL
MKSMRILFVILCMLTGGILGGMSSSSIQKYIVNMANSGATKTAPPSLENKPPNIPETPPKPAPKPSLIKDVKPTIESKPPVTQPVVTKLDEKPLDELPGFLGTLVTIGCVIAGTLLGLVFGSESLHWIGMATRHMEEMEPEETLATVGGILLGIVMTSIFIPLLLRTGPLFPLFLILSGVVFIYLSLTAVRRLIEVLPWASTSKSTIRRKSIKILDTNVIIDGRILDIYRTGFMEGQIYIPRFVLEELQLIADSSDQLRRARGRRGLDILNAAQKEFALEIGAQDRGAPDTGEGVDARLVKLAKAIGGDLVTNDYNLNKVAELEGVKVLNVNDLALSLKLSVLPGETLTVTIIREGKEPNQGIGYLNDGTMVVVEGGRKHLNETMDVSVTSVLQTTAGKMIFAETPDETVGEVDQSIEDNARDYSRGRPKRTVR